MQTHLTGRTALVTGASVGIGRACALALAREGARVAVVARRKPLLDELAREISAEAGAKGLAVVVHATDEVIWSDPVLLRRILRNLLSNAVRYTQAGRIELGAARDGAMVRLHVRDTGIGIPSNELSRIFDEYHQVGNVERDRSQGLGLGLAVVRRMAALLDHPVEVESRVGSGSTFSIRVPPGERDHIVTAPSHDEEPGLQGVLVVMVDDEEAILRGMRLLLEDWGCQVLTAGSGAAALAAVAAESRRPDILITDYRLRAGETGVDVIRALRDRLGVDLPAVLVSGDTDPALLRSLNAQGLDLLHKPVKPAHLMKTMRDLLEARRRDRSA